MNIEINTLGLKNAEKFSAICQDYPFQIYLRSGQFCVDPKSMLGVLAIFYSASDPVRRPPRSSSRTSGSISKSKNRPFFRWQAGEGPFCAPAHRICRR